MSSLFDAQDHREVVDRIRRLNPDSPAQWGKMKPAQMLAHLQVGFAVAFGELSLKRGLMGLLFGRMAKRKLLGDQPFGRNMPTEKNFVIRGERDFERERENLIAAVERFSKGGPGGLPLDRHPFFGPMTPDEWDTLMYKHLDHHLRQFGV